MIRIGSKPRLVFEPDHDSNGWSIEIYLDEGSPMMEYLGRLDLFSRVLYVEGGRSWDIPTGYERRAIEVWAEEILSR